MCPQCFCQKTVSKTSDGSFFIPELRETLRPLCPLAQFISMTVVPSSHHSIVCSLESPHRRWLQGLGQGCGTLGTARCWPKEALINKRKSWADAASWPGPPIEEWVLNKRTRPGLPTQMWIISVNLLLRNRRVMCMWSSLSNLPF